MPTRLIRGGILDSDRVNALDPMGELFYRRLLNVVDDYGRFAAKPAVLHASCYPLGAKLVTEDDIRHHLQACSDAGLVRLYEGKDGKDYLLVRDFRQQVRAKYSRFPDPPPEPFFPSKSTLSTDYADIQQLPSTSAVLVEQPDQSLDLHQKIRALPPKPPKPKPLPVPPEGPAPEPLPEEPPPPKPDPEPEAKPKVHREPKVPKRASKPLPLIVPMATLVEDGLPADVAADWVTHRKARRAPLTHAAWDGLKREAGKANWDVQTACVLAMQRGWTGFSASWLERENRDNERHKQRNGAETPYQRAQRQVMAEFVPGVASRAPAEDVTDVHDTSNRPRI